MKKYILLLILIASFFACSDSDPVTTFIPNQNEFDWIIPNGSVTGSLNPFPLAKDPSMSKVKEIDFISDNSKVAIVSMGEVIKVYPYQFISKFESVNDNINGIEYSMTYCPNTQSGLVVNRNFKEDNFDLRASGYLYNENLVLIDKKSNTYWSQMNVRSIKGKYANEYFSTYNFIELPWKTVKEYFPDALVFTDTSIKNKFNSNKKEIIKKGELVYGIIDFKINQKNEVHIYEFNNFRNGTLLKIKNISNKKILIVGNEELHFITSYINSTNATFKAVQNQFPIVMEDDQNNKWNVFGIAVSGPRKGEQLKSKTSFTALWWAWQSFYKDFKMEE